MSIHPLFRASVQERVEANDRASRDRSCRGMIRVPLIVPCSRGSEKKATTYVPLQKTTRSTWMTWLAYNQWEMVTSCMQSKVESHQRYRRLPTGMLSSMPITQNSHQHSQIWWMEQKLSTRLTSQKMAESCLKCTSDQMQRHPRRLTPPMHVKQRDQQWQTQQN